VGGQGTGRFKIKRGGKKKESSEREHGAGARFSKSEGRLSTESKKTLGRRDETKLHKGPQKTSHYSCFGGGDLRKVAPFDGETRESTVPWVRAENSRKKSG